MHRLLPVVCLPLALSAPLAAQCERDWHTEASSFERLGQTVAASGHRIVAGMGPNTNGFSSGSMLSYRFNGNEMFMVQQTYPASVEEADHIGQAVDIQGDLAVVGAPGDDEVGPQSGAVYIFRLQSSGWVEEAKLLPSNPASYWFGSAVDIDGDVVVVGGKWTENRAGDAYVYRFDGASWSLEQRIVPASLPDLGEYGSAVAVDGDRILIGAPFQGTGEQGRVFAWEFGSGIWTNTQDFAPAGILEADNFGQSIDIEGDRAMIGAPALTPPTNSQTGTVYEYAWSAGSWTEADQLAPTDTAWKMRFGFALSLEGGVLAVGAPFWGGIWNDGRVYLYREGETGWQLDEQLASSNSDQGDQFGHAVDIDRDLLVVGAAGFDSVFTDVGAVYAFSVDCAPEFYGCGGADIAASLVVVDGDTTLGGEITLGLENPLGTQTPGVAGTLLAIATAPAPGFPCGIPISGWGPAGGGDTGELLVSPIPPNPATLLVGPSWNGVGHPAEIAVGIPGQPLFAGVDVYAQGFVVELANPVTPVVATTAVRLTLGG